jgi:hypothetical protein
MLAINHGQNKWRDSANLMQLSMGSGGDAEELGGGQWGTVEMVSGAR